MKNMKTASFVVLLLVCAVLAETDVDQEHAEQASKQYSELDGTVTTEDMVEREEMDWHEEDIYAGSDLDDELNEREVDNGPMGNIEGNEVDEDKNREVTREEKEQEEGEEDKTSADENGEDQSKRRVFAKKSCGCTYWTRWLNRDRSSGTGDWETISAFIKYNKINVCGRGRPLAAKCVARHRSGWSVAFNQDTDFRTLHPALRNMKLRLKCLPEVGLACINSDQKSKRGCRDFDFSIQFRCARCECMHCEELWRDRDNPSGTGDWENRSYKPDQVCMGTTPVNAKCTVKPVWSGIGNPPRVFDQWNANTAPDKLSYPCSARDGLVCQQKDNKGRCNDYSIKYCCFSGKKYWTGWLDRDNPSGTGDWEATSKFRTNRRIRLCHGMTPLAAQCRVRRSNKIFNQWNYQSGTDEKLRIPCTPENGLVCVNKDQKDKRCKDYQIRFMCPCN